MMPKDDFIEKGLTTNEVELLLNFIEHSELLSLGRSNNENDSNLRDFQDKVGKLSSGVVLKKGQDTYRKIF
jgi:hypothetical protein